MSQTDTGIKNKLKKVKANCFLMPEIFLIPCQLKKETNGNGFILISID